MTIREKIDALDPAHRDLLVQLSLDNLSVTQADVDAMRTLVELELVDVSKEFTGIRTEVHMEVCAWCSEQEDSHT